MMTRRKLAQLAAGGAALLPGKSRAASTYTGALDGFETKVDLAAFDPVIYSRRLYEGAPLRLAFRARSRRQAEIWQKKLRARLTEMVGGLPAPRAALHAQTLEVRNFPAFRREKFVFESAPGLHVLGYLLTPVKVKPPYAAVICLPGHGRGVDDIVGVDAQGRDRTGNDGYQRDFARQVAEQGMAAVAIEQLAFGCRRDERTRKKSLDAAACQPVAGAALLLGQTMVGWRVRDVMRTVDWIETRQELDVRRVGCLGISGGGTVTLFTAALEPRIRAAMLSCSFNTFQDSIFSIAHCIDNYVPGILNWAEMSDIAGLIAPRPFFAEAGERDEIFPVAATRESFERLQKIYDVFGAADRAGLEVFDAPHQFHGAKGLPFLKRHLTS